MKFSREKNGKNEIFPGKKRKKMKFSREKKRIFPGKKLKMKFSREISFFSWENFIFFRFFPGKILFFRFFPELHENGQYFARMYVYMSHSYTPKTSVVSHIVYLKNEATPTQMKPHTPVVSHNYNIQICDCT